MDYDVIVIGGGPVGCSVARDIAAAGFKVLVVEEHPKIGLPLHCAGLISSRTLELSRVSPRVIEHKLTGARLHAPGGEVLGLHGKRVYALAIDRAEEGWVSTRGG
jgi:digeranylgeranylglycerophospholipid reductase